LRRGTTHIPSQAQIDRVLKPMWRTQAPPRRKRRCVYSSTNTMTGGGSTISPNRPARRTVHVVHIVHIVHVVHRASGLTVRIYTSCVSTDTQAQFSRKNLACERAGFVPYVRTFVHAVPWGVNNVNNMYNVNNVNCG